MFFDDHREFLETSHTANSLSRLNLRHEAIIERNHDLINGARVLDIASHDGRWSFGALQAGAAHVTGIEGRADLVDNAKRTISGKGIDGARYSFVVGDAHDVLSEGVGEMDVVMCLGFMYHTLRYNELLSGIRRTAARDVIIDTKVLPNRKGSVVQVIPNPVHIESMAVEDRFSYGGRSMVGLPSAPAVVRMLRFYGYELVDEVDWAQLIAAHPEVDRVGGYSTGERVTMRFADAS